MPTTPVPRPSRCVRDAVAVAGPNASPKVISGNQAARKPAPSAFTPYSSARLGGSASTKTSRLATRLAAVVDLQRHPRERLAAVLADPPGVLHVEAGAL